MSDGVGHGEWGACVYGMGWDVGMVVLVHVCDLVLCGHLPPPPCSSSILNSCEHSFSCCIHLPPISPWQTVEQGDLEKAISRLVGKIA